jgi:hypothetical protein
MNTFPGWTTIEAFTCTFCGVGVTVKQPVQ